MWGLVKGVPSTAEHIITDYGVPIAFGGALLGGAAAGHGLARLMDAKSVAANSDKLLESEALATEIAVTEKRIRELEKRRKQLQQRKTGEQKYDRFV